MDDEDAFLEKQMGHKFYRPVPNLGKIAIWIVLIATATMPPSLLLARANEVIE